MGAMGAMGNKMSSFLLTKYSIKIDNRCSVFKIYLLIRSIYLKMLLYNSSCFYYTVYITSIFRY